MKYKKYEILFIYVHPLSLNIVPLKPNVVHIDITKINIIFLFLLLLFVGVVVTLNFQGITVYEGFIHCYYQGITVYEVNSKLS